jgi:hypothetical protein
VTIGAKPLCGTQKYAWCSPTPEKTIPSKRVSTGSMHARLFIAGRENRAKPAGSHLHLGLIPSICIRVKVNEGSWGGPFRKARRPVEIEQVFRKIIVKRPCLVYLTTSLVKSSKRRNIFNPNGRSTGTVGRFSYSDLKMLYRVINESATSIWNDECVGKQQVPSLFGRSSNPTAVAEHLPAQSDRAVLRLLVCPKSS